MYVAISRACAMQSFCIPKPPSSLVSDILPVGSRSSAVLQYGHSCYHTHHAPPPNHAHL